jgi:hypothetical protein
MNLYVLFCRGGKRKRNNERKRAKRKTVYTLELISAGYRSQTRSSATVT